MKKILFLLLLSVSFYGQTLQNPIFGTVTAKNSANVVSPNTVVVQDANGLQGKSSVNVLPLSTATINALKLKADLSTGLIKNGLISISADPTKFNISAGIGIISNFDNPETPVSTIINFPAFTGVTPTYLTTGNITYVAINSTSAIVMQATPFTPSQRRDLIILGAVIHSNLTNINVVNNIDAPSNAIGNQLHDFIEAVGVLNITGNKYSANGANLSLNKSAGSIFKFGVNFATDWKNPHQISQSSGTALAFRYRTQNGTEGADRTTLDPTTYDLNNVLTSVPNNKFVIETVIMFQTGLTRVLKGQNYYDDLASAQAAIFTRDFVMESNAKENGVVRAYIIMKNNAASLQNATDSKIIEAQKFGGIASGGVALTFANIVSALGYTPANDTDVLHKTGDETKTGNLTINDNLISSGANTTSSNIQTGGVKMVDVGASMSNYTFYTDNFGSGAPNIRYELGSNLAHVGFNKLGTVNSALAILFDTSITSGNIDFRGSDYVTGTDLFQFTALKQIVSDFSINNNKNGGKILFPSGRIGIGTSNVIGDFTVKVPTSLTFNMGSQDDGSVAISNFAGGSYVPAISGKSGSGTGLRLFAGTSNSNTSPSMMFDIRSTTNADFSTLTNVGFRFARFSSNVLFDILKNGTLVIPVTPVTSASTYEILTRNTSSGNVEKVLSPNTYTALITQSSTGAPTVGVLGTNTVGSIVWTRTGTGTYVGTLSGAFTANKTICFVNNNVSGSITFKQTSVNTIELTTSDLTGSLLDGRLTNNSIKIEVYP